MHHTLEAMKEMLNYRLDRAETSPVAEIVHRELREAETVWLTVLCH